MDCDYTHFRGQRTWTEEQLESAVASASSWQEVADKLGLTGGSSQTTVRGHAARLGIETSHLDPRTQGVIEASTGPAPDLANLSRAGSLLSAGWFTLAGYNVSWPLEPCRYDLLVEKGGSTSRIQVKTATVRTGTSWTVWLSTTGPKRTTYDVDEIDAFFVIDGSLDYYLIPVERVGGLHALQLSAYSAFKMPTLGRSPR